MNGSFESPTLTQSSPDDVLPTGWTSNPNQPTYVQYGPSWAPLVAQDGNQFVHLGFGNDVYWLQQTFTVPIAGNYTLTWYDTTFPHQIFYGAPYDVSVTDANGSPLSSGSFDAVDATGTWHQRSLTMWLAQGSDTLEFLNTGARSAWAPFLDNVQVTAVPEPGATALLAGAGLLGFAAFRRFNS